MKSEYIEQERKQKPSYRTSAGMFHQYQVKPKEEPMTGLLQKREEQSGDKKMDEIFRMGNSFGDISLGMNKNQETALVVRKKGNQNGPSLKREQKELNQQRSAAFHNRDGKMQVNKGMPQKGAFAFQTHEPEIRTKRLLEDTGQFVQKADQKTVQEMMPFMGDQIRQKELHTIEKVERESIEQREPAKVQQQLSAGKEEKKQEKSQRLQIGNKMMREMRKAMSQARKKKEEDISLLSKRVSVKQTINQENKENRAGNHRQQPDKKNGQEAEEDNQENN